MRRIYRCGLAVWLVALLFVPAFGTTAGAKEAKDLNDGSYGGLLDYGVTDSCGVEVSEATSPNNLPGADPFWVDLVDAQGLDYKGEDVYVAVLDTGLRIAWKTLLDENHVATGYGKTFTYDINWDPDEEKFYNSDMITSSDFRTKEVGSGHGTHVASTIIGFDFWYSVSYFVHGVAPNVKIIPVRVIDYWLCPCPDDYVPPSDWWAADGPYGEPGEKEVLFYGCNDLMVSAGIDYITGLAKNQLKGKKVIISMSLGFGQEEPGIEASIQKAIDAGVIVVASAGNNGVNGMGWPGAYSKVISAGAVGWGDFGVGSWPYWKNGVPEDLKTEDNWGNDWQMYVASFSARPNKDRGQKSSDLDLCAPGVSIAGPWQPQAYYDSVAKDWAVYDPWNWVSWAAVSGTSMAAPHVSAIAAIVLEWAADDDGGNGVDLTQKHMEKILKNGAVKNWPPGDYKGATVNSVKYTWDRNDWGKGLLQADDALAAAEDYVDENF